MKNYCLLAFSLALLPFFGVAQARAQYQMPSTRPAVSPYLNLLRSGQSPSLNYYDLVRPQLETGRDINQLQAQTTTNRNAISTLEQGGQQEYKTGHRTGFMTYNRYFMNNGASASSSYRSTAAANKSAAR